MSTLNFKDAATKRFHEITERGYDPDSLKSFTHMQRIMSFNLKWSVANAGRTKSNRNHATHNPR